MVRDGLIPEGSFWGTINCNGINANGDICGRKVKLVNNAPVAPSPNGPASMPDFKKLRDQAVTQIAGGGKVYVGATRLQKAKGCPKKDPCKGPYVVALDQRTGGGQSELFHRLIDSGAIGTPYYIEVDYWHGMKTWYPQYPWSVKKPQGGSSLLSAGCHAVDARLSIGT